MKDLNNFDQSSSGINIEANLILDTDLAQENFNSFFYLDKNEEHILYFENNKLDFSLKEPNEYFTIETKGCSSEDYAKVFVLKDRITKDFTLGVMKKFVDNILWGLPQTVRVSVNDCDYYSEIMDGEYNNYDRKVLINEVVKCFDNLDAVKLRKELEGMLPDKIEKVV